MFSEMKKTLILIVSGFLSLSCVSERVDYSTTTSQSTTTPIAVETASERNPFLEWKTKTRQGVAITWQTSGLLLELPSGQTVRPLQAMAERSCRGLEARDRTNLCYCAHWFRIASFVDPVISLDHESEYSCQGSYGSWQFSTYRVDPKKGLVKTSLNEFYKDDRLLEAFLTNEVIAAFYSGSGVPKPSSLKEFYSQVKKFQEKEGGLVFDASLAENYLDNFAFETLTGENLVVRIGLTPNSRAGQANREFLELTLPKAGPLEAALEDAQGQKGGFLASESEKIVGSVPAKFTFDKSRTR